MAGNNNGRLTNAIGESLSPAAIKLTVPAEDVLGFQRVNREPSHHARPDRLLRLLWRQGARFARAGLSETRIPMALTTRAP